MFGRKFMPAGGRHDLSAEVLTHAVELRHAADKLYVDQGCDPLGYFSLGSNIGGGFTSYQIAVGEGDHNKGDDHKSLFRRFTGGTALAGAFMHATVKRSGLANPVDDKLKATEHSFLIQEGLFGKMHTTAFDHSRLTLAGDPEIVANAGGLKREFWKNVLNLTPENILVERYAELNNKETREIVRDTNVNFSNMAINLGTSREKIAQGDGYIRFNLGDDLTADVESGTKYTGPNGLILKIHRGDPVNGRHVMLIVKNELTELTELTEPTEPTEVSELTELSVRGVVLPHRDDNRLSLALEKEDLFMLAGVLSELANPMSRGIISRASMFANVTQEDKKIPQPVAEVSEKYIKRINELL